MTLFVSDIINSRASNVTGNPAPSSSLQWKRNGESIENAVASQYTVVPEDEGKIISVTQTSTSFAGTKVRTSASLGPVSPNPSGLFSENEQGVWYDPGDFNRYMQTGPELITNGVFATDLTGWQTFDIGSGSSIWSEGRLRIIRADASNYGKRRQSITTIAGKTYQLSIGRPVGTTHRVWIGSSAGAFDLGLALAASSIIFTAVGVTTWLDVDSSVNATTVEFDNISVKELIAISTATLFQDSAGITPVTAVEQPVGLMLDKRLGLVLGTELVTNGNLSGFLSNGLALLTTTSLGGLTGTGAYANILTIGKWYKVQISATSSSGTVSVNTSSGSPPSARTEIGTGLNKTFYFFADRVGFYVRCNTEASASGVSVSVRELPGNHAFQSTAIDRPILRNRYNLLTQTDTFSDWVLVNTSRSTHTDGSTIVTKLIGNQSGFIYKTAPSSIPVGQVVKASVLVKRGNTDLFGFRVQAVYPQGIDIVLNTVTGAVVFSFVDTFTDFVMDPVVQDADGFWRVSLSFKVAGNSLSGFLHGPAGSTARGWDASTLPNNSFVYAKGASLVPADQAHLPYQRVNTATDYDSDPSKFPLYLSANGTDTWMQTNSIDFTGTNKVTVFTGLRKLSDGATQTFLELSINKNTNVGVFGLYTPLSPGIGTISWSSKGTTDSICAYTVLAPNTNAITCIGNISGATSAIRADGVLRHQTGANQGTGNYGNHPLYLFRRGGTSLPFNGNFYGLIIRGTLTTQERIELTERWMAKRTGITLS